METLSFLFSIAGLAAFITSFLLKGAKMKTLLLLNATGNFLIAVSYLCVANANGTLSSVIGMAMGIINYFFSVKQKKIPVWLLVVYAAAFVIVNLTVFTSAVDIIAIAASLTAVLVVSSASGRGFRGWSLVNNFLWCFFDILRGSWGPLVSHVILTASTILGILRNDAKRKA